MARILSVLAAGAALMTAQLAQAQPPSEDIVVSTGQPVVVKDAVFCDLHSKVTGRVYRLFVHVPPGAPPAGGWPVVYVLDGNSSFTALVEIAQSLTFFAEIRPAVIVGIGYPDADPLHVLQTRNRDLTTPIDAAALARMPPNPGLTPDNTGGVDLFLKAIETEMKPIVGRLAPINSGDQTLIGHSLGGLTTVRALLTEPKAFRTFVASSPSLFWNDKAVLAGLPDFERAVKSGAVQPRVMLDAGALEEDPWLYRTAGAKLTQSQVDGIIATTQMVSNVKALTQRLAALKGGPNYTIKGYVFPYESHLSVIPAALSRALNFALSVDGDGAPQRAP